MARPKPERVIEAPLELQQRVVALHRRLEGLKQQQAGALVERWFCDRPGCDGEPHEGRHWCGHPVDSGEHTWECRHSRAEQRPPVEFKEGRARNWIMMAGRGFGKTRSGAQWLAYEAQSQPDTEWAIIAPTREALAKVCLEGESGLLRALGIQRGDVRYNKSSLLLRLANGSVISGYSSEAPVSVLGSNLSGAWLDELAKWRDATMYDNLFPAIRRGLAQTVVTTTPAATRLLLSFLDRKDGSVAVTRGSTFHNEKNLSPQAVAELRVRWAGTRMERQELFGELLEDVPGALWTASMMERAKAVLLD